MSDYAIGFVFGMFAAGLAAWLWSQRDHICGSYSPPLNKIPPIFNGYQPRGKDSVPSVMPTGGSVIKPTKRPTPPRGREDWPATPAFMCKALHQLVKRQVPEVLEQIKQDKRDRAKLRGRGETIRRLVSHRLGFEKDYEWLAQQALEFDQQNRRLRKKAKQMKEILEADNKALELLEGAPRLTPMGWNRARAVMLDTVVELAHGTMSKARTKEGAPS